MEDTDILQLWKSYNKKLEQNLILNRQNAADITKLKVQSLLASMKPVIIFTIVVGIAWVGFVDILIYHLFTIASPFFIVSAIIQVLLTKLAIGIYVYQLVLIHQVKVNEPILATQQRIAWLKASALWIPRLLFLQLPVWTTFYWNKSMLVNGTMFLYIVQGIVTLSFTMAAVWLFRNINYANKNKKWFRLLFSGSEWTPVMKSIELLQQVQEFEKNK